MSSSAVVRHARAAADPQGARVALIAGDQHQAATRRLEAELRALGVDVVRVQVAPDEPIGRSTLERLAREQGAFAAVRIVPIAAEVEVWVADRVTGKTVVREVIRGANPDESPDDAIAIGAVELLRASLLEVAATDHLQGEMAPPPEVKRIAPPPPPAELESGSSLRLSTTLEPVVDLGLGGLGAAAGAQLRVRVELSEAIDVELGGQLPLSTPKLRVPGGRIQTSTRSVDVALLRRWRLGATEPFVGLGLGWHRIGATADATESGYRTTRERILTIAPQLRSGLGLPLSSYVQLRLEGALAYALQPVRVMGESGEVAEWGRPAALIGLGFELRWPLGG